MIRRIGIGETGAPLVQAELTTAERAALLNILTLFDERFHGSGPECSPECAAAEAMAATLREAFRLDADPSTLTAEAAIRGDERRKCAAEIRADVKRMDGTLMPLIVAATLDAADVIDPDVKIKAKWAAGR